MNTAVTRDQHDQLLRPINSRRVGRRDGMSHLEAYDVRAHLIRLFGFGGWSGDVLDMTPLFEEKVTLGNGKPGYRVGYRCTYRLVIHGTGATYTETATGDGSMPESKRADAHDFAIKTAESQALKRCAINLGDQFGLSLYNKGSLDPLVGRTLVIPAEKSTSPQSPREGEENRRSEHEEVDSHITEQLAPEDAPAGQDEPQPISDAGAPQPTSAAAATAPARQGAQDPVTEIRDKALAATKKGELVKLLMEVGKAGLGGAETTDADGKATFLEPLINHRLREVA